MHVNPLAGRGGIMACMNTHTLAEYDVLSAIHERRSVRAYTSEPVGAPVIRQLLAAAVRAPTAMHREPWRFAVVQDKAKLERWSNRAKAMLARREAPIGWGAMALRPSQPAAAAEPAFNLFYDAGTLVVICRPDKSRFADADCWLAAGNLMLAAQAHGLGSCVIGLAVPVLNGAAVKRELCIPQEGAAVVPIILGHPRERAAPTPRHAPELLRWINPQKESP